MSTIKFSNGATVNFNGTPTQADIQEISTHLGLNGNSIQTNTNSAPKKDLLEKTGEVVNSIFPGKQIGESIVKTGANIANLATGGINKFEQNLPENKIDVPALAGDYTQAGLMTGGGALPVARAARPFENVKFPGAGEISASLGTKAAALAKNIAGGAGLGYVDDVSGNLKSGEKNASAFKPGLGTAIGAVALPGGAVATGLEKKQIGQIPDQVVNNAKSALANSSAEKAKNFALELTAPKLDKGLAREAIKQGSNRVKQTGGLFGKTSLLPNEYDTRIADSVRDVVNPKNRLIENVDAINRKVTSLNQGVGNYIKGNNTPIDAEALKSKFQAAKEENNLLFAGHKPTEAAYDAVTNEFFKQVDKTGRTDTQGLFEARQNFDKHLRSKIPSLFQKDATGQYLDPRDNIRKNAVLDTRRAVNDYIADILPEGNPYKQTLRKESDMLEAIARIADKNAGKISVKNLRILMARHPVLSTIGTTALTTAGLAGLGNIVKAAAGGVSGE